MNNDLNPVFTIPWLVSARWNEALKKQDIRTWRACAYLAGLEADLVEREEPDHVLVPVLRGIADDAHARYLSLMPRAVG